MFHTSAVVPTAIKKYNFTSSGQMLDVALHVVLVFFPVIGSREGHNPEHPRADFLCQSADHASFTGRVTALEDHHDLRTGLPDPILQVTKLDLQISQLLQIKVLVQFSCFTGLVAHVGPALLFKPVST
jgi:hypothetical protein